MHILIVDDGATNRKLLRAILEAEQFIVLEARDGVEALAVLEREKIDAIISDILMPRMDGYRLCRNVRAHPWFFATPFVFYTATYTSPSDEKLARDLGADKFLKKPADAAVIVKTLHEAIESAFHAQPKPVSSSTEMTLMKEYTERLVTKLEQKNVELELKIEALLRAEEQMRLQSTALETASNAIAITDHNGAFLWVNPAFIRLSGYAPEEVIGKTPRILKSDKHRPAFYEHLWQTILSGEPWEGRFINRRKDGGLYHGEQTITPVRSEGGKITHFIGIMNDVTQRKQAEEELRLTHGKLRQLLAHSPGVIYTLKIEGSIEGSNVAPVVVSDNIERLLGVTVAEASHYEWWLGSLHPDDRDRVLATMAEALRNGGSSMEYRIRHKDGSYRWVEDHNRMVRDESGQPKEAVGVWTDITEKKEMEKQFLRAQRMESIGRLASGVAHDLNNILGPILMSASLLRLNLGPEETEQIVAQIESSAQRGAQIVKQLLTLGRGVEGKRGVLQSRHLIKEMIQIAEHTFPKSISIKQNVASDLWTVVGDATQLHQVLLNLSVNACDAMPEGGKLSVEAENVSLDEVSSKHPEAKPGPYILIQVKDTGTGILPEIKDKIFEPFFTTKEPGKGTGLGLATVAEIVRSHGGFIELESAPGKGTNFKIYLPATPKLHAAETAETAEQIPMGHGEVILVIDDELPFREMVKKILEHAAYQVVLAMDGAEALAAFCKHQKLIRAVLCDLMMPGLDGVAVAQILKKLDPQLPILISSGLAEDPAQSEKLVELKSLGVKTFLMKPYRPNELLIALNEAIQAGQAV